MLTDILAQRSITYQRIDPFVGLRTSPEIKTELMAKQEWKDIPDIIKFGNNTHVFKLLFSDTTMTQKSFDKRCLYFNMKISPEEIVINILICFKCYQMEDGR